MADNDTNPPIAEELQLLDQQIARLQEREAELGATCDDKTDVERMKPEELRHYTMNRGLAEQLAARRARLQSDRDALLAEQAEVQAVAKASGAPLDVARRELRTARGLPASTDVLTMTPEQYRRHKTERGIL